MKQLIDINTWNRKDHYLFFSGFSNPFFSVTVKIPVGALYRRVKEAGESFFLSYLYLSLRAANEIEAFRYRIENDAVYLYDVVNASPTINRPDGTFGFAYMNYYPERARFISEAEKEIERIRQSTGLAPAVAGENVIHYSSIPWIDFTALTHAYHTGYRDCIPKISFGKMTETPEGLMMPLSVHAHHGLMDGYQVSLFIDRFTELIEHL